MRPSKNLFLALALTALGSAGCEQKAAPHGPAKKTELAQKNEPTPSPENPNPDSVPGTAQGSVPTPQERAQCLRAPLSPSAEELPTLAGLTHEVQGDNRQVHVFLPPNPARFAGTDADAWLTSFKARFPTTSVRSVRSCGPETTSGKASAKVYCAELEVPICSPWLPEASALASVLGSEGLGLRVEIRGRVGPRCQGDNCLPIGYHASIPARDDALWSGRFTLPYRSDALRTKVKEELGRGSCQADGDCVLAGCGNGCEAWQEPQHGATCPAFTALADAYCGCVSGACAWFVAPQELIAKANVTVDGWKLATHSDSRDLATKPGDQVLRELVEGPWLLRQLERLAHVHKQPIPGNLTFELAINRRFQVERAQVEHEGRPAPTWVRDVFLHLPVPVPTFRPKSAGPNKISVRGNVTFQKL